MKILSVPILKHDSEEVATHNEVVPLGYYVIVGRGVAAWYNHLTLLESDWGRKRLAGLPVLHVGFKEPWSLRGEERMGQWPRMLNFFEGIDGLGLSKIDSTLVTDGSASPDYRTWLRSTVFAKSIEEVEKKIVARYPNVIDADRNVTGSVPIDEEARGSKGEGPLLRIRNGFVGTIEKQDGWDALTATTEDYLGKAEFERRKEIDFVPPGATVWANKACPYRLSVFYRPKGEEPYLKFFYAHKIDICSGVSSARQPRVSQDGTLGDYFRKAFLSPDSEPEPRPADDATHRIVDGNTYIGSPNSSREVVAVIKSGAVAAQAVQSALTMPGLGGAAKEVWWINNGYFSKQKALHSRLSASETVPGARNQLEIAGTTPDAELQPTEMVTLNELLGVRGPSPISDRDLQILELDTHFNETTNPVFKDARPSEARRDLLRGKLFNLSHHDMGSVSEGARGRLKIELKLALGRKPRKMAQSEWELGAEERKRQAQSSAETGLARVLSNEGVEVSEVATFARSHDLILDAAKVKSIEVDVLVYSSGQDYRPEFEGSPAYLVRKLGGFSTVSDPASGYPNCLSDAVTDTDVGGVGKTRFMGGAMVGATAPGGLTVAGFADAHQRHFVTLPAEAPAAGGGGLNPALTNIQRANGFEYEKPKINTLSRWEMIDAGLTKDSAYLLEAVRERSVRGYTPAEYGSALEGHAEYCDAKARDHESDVELLRAKIESLPAGPTLAGEILGLEALTGWGRAEVKAWREYQTVGEFIDLFEQSALKAKAEAANYRKDKIELDAGKFQF